MNELRRVLVTGANGFVGGLLRARLEREGIAVTGTWYLPGADPQNPAMEAAGLVHLDLSDPACVDRALDVAGTVDAVFHLAALASVSACSAQPDLCMDINLTGTVRLVNALRARQQPVRFLFAGSAEIYGIPLSLPLREEHPVQPVTPYGIAKAAADQFLAWCHKAHGMDVIRLRMFNHTGPGQPDTYVLPSFCRQVAEMEAGLREPVLKTGDLGVRRDLLHVDDVLEAYLAAARRGKPGAAYNICRGEAPPLSDVVDLIRARSLVPFRVETDPARLRPVDIPVLLGDASRFRGDTGWTPRKSLDDMVSDLLDYWRGRIRSASDAS